ncbi:MAG: branched-chain amino acid transaminase [Patescibacteria group bacterium]|nr:branched-chain amino acid transaminase [Patescibacteria group bacterium]
MKKNFVWFDGKFIPLEAARVPLLNHSLHYGSAAFEGIRCYDTPDGPAIFRLKTHVDRLFHSAEVLGMKIPYSRETVIEATKGLIKKNGLPECYIRPIIFYGDKMGLSPVGAPINFAIAVWPWGKYLGHDKVSAHIAKFIRLHHRSGVMSAKISGYYFNSILASLDATKNKADEALLLDDRGCIAEGPGENIFFVRGKTLFTPKKGSILPGITRDSIIKIAKDLDYKVVEKDIRPSELAKYDEAFFTGTAAEVTTIGKINRAVFSKKSKISAELSKTYLDAVHGKIKKYQPWLDYIK